jgi:hypothetical protein
MIFKPKWMYAILQFALSIGLIAVLTGCLTSQPEESPYYPDTSRPVGKIIFQIGQEDLRYYEFTARDFRDQTEYTCRVGVDCLIEKFPRGLTLGMHYPGEEDMDVERVKIIFELQRNYKELILRLARAGSETSEVTIDETQKYFLTNEMLGSSDRGTFGAYNLSLGELKRGTHTIELTIRDDGKGNGMFAWDALSLVAK